LTAMDYPFVSVRAHVPHWPYQALFVTTRAVVNSTDENRTSEPGFRENNVWRHVAPRFV
jgi:hypothetical protein